MATTLDSSRSASAAAVGPGVATAPTSGNTNKTSTICFNLGLIFRRTAHFFGPFEEDFHTLIRSSPEVRGKVQLRHLPQVEAPCQLVTQVMPGVVESGQRRLFLRLAPPNADAHVRVPQIGSHLDVGHIDGGQPRVIQLKRDQLRQFLANRLRNPLSAMLIHTEPRSRKFSTAP